MPYKDPEKARQNALERSRRYRERHAEESRARSLAWYHAHKKQVAERVSEYRKAHRAEYTEMARIYRETHKAKLDEYRRTHREQINAYKRAWRAARKNGAPLPPRKKREAKSVEEARFDMELEKCPYCKAGGGIKASKKGYRCGCVTRTCKAWVDRPWNETYETRTLAEAAWQKFVAEVKEELAREALSQKKNQEAAETPQDAPEARKAPDVPPQDADATEGKTGGLADDSEAMDEEDYVASVIPPEMDLPKPTEEEAEEEQKEPEEEPMEEEAEEAADRYARFELVLDGVRYVCTPGEAGCDGCAFFHVLGVRNICLAGNEEDARPARDLCEILEGQWHEVKEED